MKPRALLAAIVVAFLAASGGSVAQPLVIAHRGASGYLPEHTLGGYELAIRMGADYIEPDLQLTRDGALVAMHDATLARTTDVAERFAPRNGVYRVADFTLAEIKTLTVRPTGTGKATHPGFTPGAAEPWRVPTFQEVIALAQGAPKVGIYPEAKQADPAMEDAILETLTRNGHGATRGGVFIQSFSDETLRSLHAKARARGTAIPQALLGVAVMDANGKARVGVLINTPQARTLSLEDVAGFAEGVGVAIHRNGFPVTRSFIDQAHAAGLKVHGWTFAKSDATRAAAEYRKYLDIGMDGMFSNYPDLAVKARDAFVHGK